MIVEVALGNGVSIFVEADSLEDISNKWKEMSISKMQLKDGSTIIVDTTRIIFIREEVKKEVEEPPTKKTLLEIITGK